MLKKAFASVNIKLRTYRHKKLYQYLNLNKVVVNTVVKKGLLMYEFMSFTENRKQIKNYFIIIIYPEANTL